MNGSSTSVGAAAFQAREAPHVVGGDQLAVDVAQHRLEQHLDRERQPRETGGDAGLGERVEPVDRGPAEAGVEGRARAEHVGLHGVPRLAVGRARGLAALRRPERELIPAPRCAETAGLAGSKKRSRRSAALRMPTRRETATRPGRAPARSVRGAPASNRCRPDRRVSISSARQSRPGPRSAVGSRPLPRQRLGRADQHAPGRAGSVHRQVEAVVHAVDEVDVQGSRSAEEGRRARRAPAMDVGRRVARAQVGLGLDDARLERAPAQASHQHAADQGARGLRGRESEKRPEPMPLTGCHAAEYRPRADEGCGGSSSGRLVVERTSTAGTPDDPHRDRADHEPREGHDRHGRQQRQHHVNETQRILLDPSAGRTARKQPLPPLAAYAATSADATGRSGGGTSTGAETAPSSGSLMSERQ